MKQLVYLTFLAFMIGAATSAAINTRLHGYHSGRGFHGFATRPGSIAPQWATHLVKRFEERHKRRPTQTELEQLASAEFTLDLRRMRTTWNGVIEWALEETGSKESNLSSSP